ncbi:MAG: YopX family protein [Roseburia sp.]|nr:YopX family protein [Roseburia sp.]
MSELLFRAKRKDTGEWVEGLPSYGSDGTIREIEYMKETPGEEIPEVEYVEVDPETICQYTGVKDERGKKIWEEDFVRIDNKWNGRVIWWDDVTAFCVIPDNDMEQETYCVGQYKDENDIKVIGSRFDIQKLLDDVYNNKDKEKQE